MKIKVFIQKTNEKKIVEINNKSNVSDLLKKIAINPTTVIVTKNKEIINDDYKLSNNDYIEILSVISGG